MKKLSKLICSTVLTGVAVIAGWLFPACNKAPTDTNNGQGEFNQDEPVDDGQSNGNNGNNGDVIYTPPAAEKVNYIYCKEDGVNIRSGAGTGYSSLGKTQKGTRYALLGRSGSWYKTYYKNKVAYIHSGYCTEVDMDKSANEQIENIIAEGCKYLGVVYVYGAVRYHDGYGNKISGFTTTAFDCSSLMQYIFKTGAGINLQVNTRTQIYQGTTVKKSGLKRGDLLFFTNASRKNNKGIERVGHVALYLGDNLILHTASDYAKIEDISSTRWGYYIQAQRIL